MAWGPGRPRFLKVDGVDYESCFEAIISGTGFITGASVQKKVVVLGEVAFGQGCSLVDSPAIVPFIRKIPFFKVSLLYESLM